jgi:hypothetical protein
LFHHPVEFPTAVTHKSLTGWSRLMDHQKAERVYRPVKFGEIWTSGMSQI